MNAYNKVFRPKTYRKAKTKKTLQKQIVHFEADILAAEKGLELRKQSGIKALQKRKHLNPHEKFVLSSTQYKSKQDYKVEWESRETLMELVRIENEAIRQIQMLNNF